ncbi:MAG: hypothetical protein ACKO85_01930 [Isosphaeraceae bacterium]
MGRKKNEAATDADKLVKTYLNEEEHKRLRHAAAELNMNLQDYIRFALLKSIDETLRDYLEREFQKKRANEG